MRHPFALTRVALQTSRPAARRQFAGSAFLRRAFEDGDVVILREKRDASHDGTLIKLQSSESTHNHRGTIPHSHIIGKQPRQVVQSSKGTTYRIHEPTLAEYVRLTPRLVTPIYPADTNLIVSLLDIHVDASTADSTAPLEILEAGTGHGALTLHLSRAIHAANPPAATTTHYRSAQEPEDAVYGGESISDLEASTLELWKQQRRAIVHTLDISGKHSKHARKIVQGFRRGIYYRNVDFHVGDISAWIASQRTSRRTEDPFLTHVFLDLPGANHHFANIAPALHVNGLLAVFNPSITQIVECVETIREHKMPYLLDQVIELGAGCIREWDVRAVKPRATLKTEEQPGSTAGAEKADQAAQELAKDEEDKWAMICRPKVGHQVVGGGFLGLWRRMDQY
ncbi:S-adenosyl-L-methionine-dependent methyltransferase, partial [Melanomma pulvis-pyrius CBS 109.77]